MTLKKQSQEIADLSMRYLSNRGNDVIRVYRRKLTVYGNNYLLYVYRTPKATLRSKKKFKFKQMDKKRNKTSFNRARQNLFRLIACNEGSSPQRPTFWTFTFDPSRYKDIKKLETANYYFKRFRQKLNRQLGFRSQYIAVPEFQKNGNVHYHVMFFNLPFIAVDISVYKKNPRLLSKKVYDFTMKDVWIYGFAEPILLDRVNHIAHYFTKYMSKAFHQDTGNRTYGEKLYFSSKGLKRPEEYYNEIAIDHILSQQDLKIESKSISMMRGLKIIHLTKKLE